MASSTNKRPPRYAEGTKIPVEKSHIAVQKILKQYSASNSAKSVQITRKVTRKSYDT